MLTDEQVFDAAMAALTRIQADDWAATDQDVIEFARAVEREAYRRAAAACRQVGNTGEWAFIAAHHCAGAVLALGARNVTDATEVAIALDEAIDAAMKERK